MVEDPKWELAILATVQGFYEKLLQDHVGGEIPVPAGLEAISLQQGDGEVRTTLDKMRRWLRLLDQAITPAMLRRAFTSEIDPEIAEAMLRYYTRKKDASDVNRDKTDLVATFLYRHPRVPGQWERRGYGLDGSLPLSPFEIALIEILADADVPSLSEEHVQLLRRFDPLQQEAQSYPDLNALLDSEIIVRVRELKQLLDSSFFHPGVLATIAPYNAAFCKRFDELFHSATAEIREFASALQEQGGSILGNVEGVDVTVEHVASLEENALLKLDYSMALDKFRRVSKLKQALQRRPPIRRVSYFASVPTPNFAKSNRSGAKPAPATRPRRPAVDVQAMRAAVTPQQISTEESKVRQVEESIRVFVRVADPKFRQVVPMRFFNLTLTPGEAEACSADYLEEKTQRGSVARALLRIVAVVARISTELEELRRAENSPSLWKLHADSLLALLEVASALSESAARVMSEASAQGNTTGAETINISLQRLHQRSELTSSTLAQAGTESQRA
ncbi:MAG TPA: hypothetical protein VEU94_02125 [Terriglobales bacterium]|nr:hypothetical protein [Terriglobales bacterium]